MKRLVRYDVVKDTAKDIKQKLDFLFETEKKLIEDIEKLKLCYQGKDADIIIEKYKSKSTEITKYRKLLTMYANYFEWISGSYGESHKKLKKDVNEELPELEETKLEELENISFDDQVLEETENE